MPLQPTTTADNNDFNMISELSTSSLTPTQIRTGVENGFNFIKSITNYGTLPNLTTDSTSAFLMAQMSGGMIYIPNGTYKANIVINSDSIFVGESLRNVIIEPYDITKPVISIDRTAVDALQHNFGFIDNITFKGISGVGIGLSLAAKAPAVIKDMKLGRLVFKDLDTGIYTNSSTAAGEIYQLTADVLYFERCTTYAMNCIDLNQSTFNAIHIDDTSTASNRFKLSGNNNKIGHLYTSGGVELVSGNGLVIDLLCFEAVKASRLVTNSNAMIKYNMTSSTIKTIMIQTCGESGTKLNSVLFLTKLGLVIGEINIFGTNYITYLLDNLLSATGSGLSIGKSDVITQYSLPSTYSTLSTIVKTKKMILRNILHTNGNVYDYVGTSRSIKRVDTLADLRAIIVPDDTVHATGYYIKGDGAFESNNFEWDSTSVEDDNGGTIIKLTAVVTGRYKLNTKRFVTPEMFGAVGDRIVDDTVNINKTLLVHKNVVFRNKYLIDPLTSIVLQSNSTLYFFGSEFYAKASSFSTTNIILIKDVINVECFGKIKVYGERNTHIGTSGEWGMGVSIFGDCDNINIDTIEAYDCWGDGVYISAPDSSPSPKNITINKIYSKNNRRQGVSIVACDGVFINSIYAAYTNGTAPEAGIDFEPNTTEIKNVTILHLHTDYNNGNGIQFAKVFTNSSISNINIYKITSNYNLKNGIEGYKFKDLTIGDITCEYNSLNGFSMTRDVENLTVNKGKLDNNGLRGLSIILSSQVNNSKNITFYNTTCNNNNTSNSSQDGARIEVMSGTLSRVKFYNCDFADTQTVHLQRYGFTSSPTNLTGLFFDQNCTFSGNTTGDYLIDSSFDTLFKGTQTKKYGSTASRPTADIGEQYFDTTIGKPIWWNGTFWKDGSGVNV